jgi:hypothetical protein
MKAHSIQRSLNGPSRSAMKRHARQTGEIMWAWNLLHAGFFHIFAAIVSPSNHKAALAVWHSVQSDKAQREMAVAAAKSALPVESRLLKNIEWVGKRAEDLSHFRNDAAHVLITMGLNEKMKFQVWPDPNTAKPAAVERLLKKPVSSYWETVRGDMFSLGVYTALHADHIRTPQQKLPQRPRLLAIQAGSQSSKKKRRAKKVIRTNLTRRSSGRP